VMAECSRRLKCSISNYFTYDDISTCIVKVKEERLCKKVFKGKFTTNLKAQLKLDKLKEFQAEGKKTKKKTAANSNMPSGQTILTEIAHTISTTECKTEVPYMQIIGTPNVPLSLVENVKFKEFKELLQ